MAFVDNDVRLAVEFAGLTPVEFMLLELVMPLLPMLEVLVLPPRMQVALPAGAEVLAVEVEFWFSEAICA